MNYKFISPETLEEDQETRVALFEEYQKNLLIGKMTQWKELDNDSQIKLSLEIYNQLASDQSAAIYLHDANKIN